MTLAVLNIDWQTLADAVALGSIYALMAVGIGLVFRPLRGQTPAVMLVATFAIAFLLQSVALLWFGPLGKIAFSLASLNQPVTVSGVDIRKITIVAVVVAVLCLVALSLLL